MEQEITKSINPNSGIKEKAVEKRGLSKVLFDGLREFIAVSFWVYAVAQIFFINVDGFVSKMLPAKYSWVMDLKFLYLIGIISLVWLFTKNISIISWFFYILLYPFIVIFFKFPLIILKQRSWNLAIAVTTEILSFFSSFKYKFIAFSLFSIATVVVLLTKNQGVLLVSVLLIFFIILSVYYRNIRAVFKPSSSLRVYEKLFSKLRGYRSSLFALDEGLIGKDFQTLNSQQLEKWYSTLQISVFYNRFCLFAAKKLKDYQGASLNVLMYALDALAIAFLTALSFAVINFGIFKIDNTSFIYKDTPTFFTFFYYGFNNFFFNSIPDLSANSTISQMLSMVEFVLAFILVAILIALMFSVRSQKHVDSVNETINRLEQQGADIERQIQNQYMLTDINAAIEAMIKIKSGIADFLYLLSRNI